MASPNRVSQLARQVEDLASGAAQKRIVTAAGVAGKKAALDALTADLGGDRAFSGMRRKAKLNVGFEVEGFAARMNFRPGGLWVLAEQGRRSAGTIRPRRRGGKKALLTPAGPRASSSYGPSRGLGTFSSGVRRIRQVMPDAAVDAIAKEIGKF